MNDPRNDPVTNPGGSGRTEAIEPPPESEYKFELGDKILIPGHTGNYVGIVVHRYASLDEACDKYQKSYRTILQQPRGKEMEYRIIAVNKAGEGEPPNTAMCVL